MHLSPLLRDATQNATASGRVLPVLAKGFRPFFLLAALYAVVTVPLWLAIVNGHLAPSAYLEPVVWHAHEMTWAS